MIDSGLLRASEVLDALSSHIAVLDESGEIVLVNQAWSRFARRQGGPQVGDAYLGANYVAVCRAAADAGDASALTVLEGVDAVRRGERTEFVTEYPCDTPDQEHWYQMSVTRSTSGVQPYLVVAHADITARKQSERALTASERLLRSVLEALPVGVWIVDAAGRIVDGNAAGRRIWAGARYVGLEEFGEYKGWWLDTGRPIAADEWAAARAIRKGETSIDEEIEIECFDGTRKIILNSALPLRDSAGGISGAIIVNQDITARKRAEAEREAMLHEQHRLRQVAIEANRAKDDFIATLAHELRTPLQAVLGWASILQHTLHDEEVVGRAAAAVERNARLQGQLLEDALDINRIVRGSLTIEPSDLDLATIVDEVVESLRPAALEKHVSVVCPPGARPVGVRGDAIRLQQVVWNLLSNAVKFTPEGGRIEVRTGSDAGWAVVSVQDNGIGIAPEFMPYLFDRFRQAEDRTRGSRKGLGLGLAIVKELVERHGGSIAAESAGEGVGATFTVRLPLAGGAAPP